MTNGLPDLGDKVRNKITDFEGIVTSCATHIAGCDRLWVEPKIGTDGKAIDGQWIDIDLAEIIEPEAVAVVQYERNAPGGIDLPAPTRSHKCETKLKPLHAVVVCQG